MEWFEILLRGLCLALALPVIFLSWRGFLAFGKGDQWLDNGFMAMSFLVASSAVGFQVVNLGLPRTSETLTLPMVTMISALVVALLRLVRLRKQHTRALQVAEAHLDLVMPMLELASCSSGEADVLAGQARAAVARHRVKGTGDDAC